MIGVSCVYVYLSLISIYLCMSPRHGQPEDCTKPARCPPRRVQIALQTKLKEELGEIVKSKFLRPCCDRRVTEIGREERGRLNPLR